MSDKIHSAKNMTLGKAFDSGSELIRQCNQDNCSFFSPSCKKFHVQFLYALFHFFFGSAQCTTFQTSWYIAHTTGNSDFAVCHRHLAKTKKHLTKVLPSVTLDKQHTASTVSANS